MKSDIKYRKKQGQKMKLKKNGLWKKKNYYPIVNISKKQLQKITRWWLVFDI